MSELSHQGATRLIYLARLSETERHALRDHLRSCEECRQNAILFGVLENHLLTGELPTRPSPQFTAVYREKAARRSRRSQIMKPVYAVGGLVALALIVLAGWFIVRATPETTTLEPVPVETAEIIAPAAESTETAVPPTEEPPLTKAPPPTETPSLYQTYEIGEEIWTSDYADLNGDGYLDVTLADLGSNAVILLFNRGDGTFEESAQIATGENPYGLAAADLDADQDNDLVITNHPDEGNAVISILLNNGDGTFQPRIDYPIAIGSWFPTTVDLDGDEDLDLVMDLISDQTGFGEDSIGIWFNNGDGTFIEGDRTYPGLPMIGDITPSDLNGDTNLDLVIRNWPDPQVSVLLSDGSGGFGERADYVTEERTYSLGVSDFNGDDYPDVVTANAFGIVSVLLNDGNGAFPDKVDYDVGGEVWTIVSLDVTGDTYADLLIGPTGSGMASLLTNNGDGTFELAKDYYFPGIWAADFDVIDVDLDGRLELIAFGENALHVIPLELP